MDIIYNSYLLDHVSATRNGDYEVSVKVCDIEEVLNSQPGYRNSNEPSNQNVLF